MQVNSVKSLLLPSDTQMSFAWSGETGRSADILLTSLCVQQKEAHFASQEVDVDLKQICRRGHRPRSLKPRCTRRGGVFLKDKTKQHVTLVSIYVCAVAVFFIMPWYQRNISRIFPALEKFVSFLFSASWFWFSCFKNFIPDDETFISVTPDPDHRLFIQLQLVYPQGLSA